MTAHVCGVAAVAFLLQANRNPVTQRRDESGQSVPGKGWAFQTKSLLAGVAALAALIGGQVLHRPAAFVVHASTTTNQLFAPTPVERTLAIHEGRFLLNLRELPVMGSPEASRVIVSLFDYTCHHCRYMHGQLKTVQHTFSNELAIVSLPLPLDEHCNRFARQTPSAHVGACEYARLGLAVWRAKPAVFSEFDDWVFAPHLPAALNEVRRRAEELAGRDALERALADGWGDRRILEDVAIYEANYRQSRRGEMPQLIIGSGIVAGVIDSMEELYRIIEERLGLVRAR